MLGDYLLAVQVWSAPVWDDAHGRYDGFLDLSDLVGVLCPLLLATLNDIV